VPELIIRLTDGRTQRQTLSGAAQVMGRDPNCDIPVDDPSTSRRHARISNTPQGYAIEDMGSKNGTLVNDVPCSAPVVLKDGDHVLIGSVAVVFSESGLHSPPSVVIEDDATTGHSTKYASSNKRLLLPQRRLEMIYDLCERLTTLQSADRLVEDAMGICFETLHFERGAVGVRRPNQRTLDWPVVRNLRGAEGELTISRTLLNRALEHGERATFPAGGSVNADPTMSIVQHGIRSAMCVPLMHRDQILGVIYGDRTSTSTVYTNEDVDFLAGIAQLLAIGLMNWRRVEEERQVARLNQDLDLARRIQTGLFPANLPNREGLKIAALNEPGRRVSGDYYDVIERSDGRVWCIVADVTGEGVSAAMLMASLQASVRVTIDETDDPAALLTRWNKLICRNTDQARFITCVCALIDPNARHIRFASAGHPPSFIVQPGGVAPRELVGAEAGFPLGIVVDYEFETAVAEVPEKPFGLFCYTDGVIEAMDAEGNQFGTDRLIELLSDAGDLNPTTMIKQVRKAVTQFVGGAPQSDDITMLAARVG